MISPLLLLLPHLGRKVALEDEGAMSPQSDENITSLCLEAMNQDDQGYAPRNLQEPQAAEPDPLDALWDEEEFSNIIHMGTSEDVADNEGFAAGINMAGQAGLPARSPASPPIQVTRQDFADVIHMATEPDSSEAACVSMPDFHEVLRMTSDMSVGEPCPPTAPGYAAVPRMVPDWALAGELQELAPVVGTDSPEGYGSTWQYLPWNKP